MNLTSIKIFILLLTFPLMSASGCGKENKTDQHDNKEEPVLRVLGYLYTSGNWMTALDQVSLDNVTDINIAFLNPDASGNFEQRSDLGTLVAKAHEHGVRVFFSIGGGSPPEHLETLLNTTQNRTKLVQGIVALIKKYDFDGVDIDLENTLINEHYAPFVEEVSKAVKPLGKLVTAALASWNSDLISDATLAHYDFINIMSYDATGPWNLDNAGPHSPYSMATNDFDYYHKTRKIPASKLFIGVPFYGYGFGEGVETSMYYRDIVNQWPGSELKDEVAVQAGARVYYNGIPTIKQKTKFALDQGAGGVMIWHLLHDTKDDKSLLKAINETIKDY